MNDRRKKLLMIFYRPPFPLIGGDKIRMVQNLKILSNSFSIDVVFINDKKTDKHILENISKFAENVIPFEFKKYRFYLSTFLGLIFNRKPLQVNYYYFRKVQKWIDSHINEYDIIFCHTIRSAEYVKNKPVYKVIDFVDAISMNYEKAAKESESRIWSLLYNIDKSRVLKYESQLLNKFDKKIIISDIDKNYILRKSNPNEEVSIVQNAIDVKEIKSYNVDNYLVFVGKMDYEPNISAVTYFSSKIFPVILEKFPDLKFYIVGFNPTSRVKALSKNANIRVYGYVENLDEIISKSKLVVAPMISGAGIQNKILMAMALKKCIITTHIGAEGLNNLDGINGKPLEIAGTTSEFILKTINLIQDDGKRGVLEKNAYDYVRNNFSFDKVKEQLLSIVNFEDQSF